MCSQLARTSAEGLAGTQVCSHRLSATHPQAPDNAAHTALFLLSGMAPRSLELLLEGTGLHALVNHVLPLLGLHELGRLATVCQRLHTVVADAPEHVWQASARLSQPHLQHPVHRAASCRAYLREQHALHAAIDAGSSRHECRFGSEPGAVAPDLTTCALLVRDPGGHDDLVLVELSTSRELKRFRLPAREYLKCSELIVWDPCGRLCMLPWGEAWSTLEGASTDAGACIVDTWAGAVAEISLGVQGPGCPVCDGFSPAGLLLVCHTVAARLVWTAFCASGVVQHRINVPTHCLGAESQELSLSPSGDQAALLVSAARTYTLWDLPTGRTRQHDLPAEFSCLQDVAWCPSSSRLLCCTQRHALVLDLQARLLSATSFSSCPGPAMWEGDLVAIMALPENAWDPLTAQCTQLFMFAVQEDQLLPTASFDITQVPGDTSSLRLLGPPRISPDWQHIALSAVLVEAHTIFMNTLVLLVLRADGTLCLDCPCPRSGFPISAGWSASGSAVASHQAAALRSPQDAWTVDIVTFL